MANYLIVNRYAMGSGRHVPPVKSELLCIRSNPKENTSSRISLTAGDIRGRGDPETLGLFIPNRRSPESTTAKLNKLN